MGGERRVKDITRQRDSKEQGKSMRETCRVKEKQLESERQRERERDYITIAGIFNPFEFTLTLAVPSRGPCVRSVNLKADTLIWTHGHVETQQVSCYGADGSVPLLKAF